MINLIEFRTFCRFFLTPLRLTNNVKCTASATWSAWAKSRTCTSAATRTTSPRWWSCIDLDEPLFAKLKRNAIIMESEKTHPGSTCRVSRQSRSLPSCRLYTSENSPCQNRLTAIDTRSWWALWTAFSCVRRGFVHCELEFWTLELDRVISDSNLFWLQRTFNKVLKAYY